MCLPSAYSFLSGIRDMAISRHQPLFSLLAQYPDLFAAGGQKNAVSCPVLFAAFTGSPQAFKLADGFIH